MKYIQAIIAPDRLDAVTKALGDAEIFRLTISEVEGAGHEKRSAEVAGESLALDFLPKIRLEIAVNDAFVEPAVRAIMHAAGDSPSVGAGKILIFPLDDCVRIRTGERGPDAI